jgi:hypothetical protein
MYAANPYAPPVATAQPLPATPVLSEFPASVTEPLRATKPWVRFLGIMGFIGTGLMVLVGLVLMVLPMDEKLPRWLGLVYIFFAAIYIPPSLFLFRYASAIERFLFNPSFDGLGEALTHQKSFWRLVGIVMLAILGIYAIGIVGAIVAGVISKS